jgi:ubiquinone/menaquinone biosynthesis C-methylase UbiE
VSWFTPARRRGVELLDDPRVDPAVRQRAIADVARSNRWLGGLRAASRALAEASGQLPHAPSNHVTLLDVGTGMADIPVRARELAARAGVTLVAIGLDQAPTLLAAARRAGRIDHAVCADAMALPFRDAGVDLVLASQLLHHFPGADAARLLGELSRVARSGVVVSDLRRSWFAACGFWLVAFALRFHRVTRHDGVVSVLRGFTPAELRGLVESGAGITPDVRRRLGYRLVASWRPRPATAAAPEGA